MANKKSKTHTGQAGVVGQRTKAETVEGRVKIKEYQEYPEVMEVSPNSIKEVLTKLKEKRWKETEQEFQEWLEDPIDGSKCTYASAQRLELIKFFKSKFLK